jgi:predicted nucleic acid-binding protein
MYYLDTSAFLKLYIREAGSTSVQNYLTQQEDPLPLSEILEMEFTNALRLKVFWGDISQEQASEQLALFEKRKKRGFYYYPVVHRSELMATFRELSESTAKLGCRTLDVLHVAYARIYGAENFVTFDAKQKKMALKSGFNVPELD